MAIGLFQNSDSWCLVLVFLVSIFAVGTTLVQFLLRSMENHDPGAINHQLKNNRHVYTVLLACGYILIIVKILSLFVPSIQR